MRDMGSGVRYILRGILRGQAEVVGEGASGMVAQLRIGAVLSLVMAVGMLGQAYVRAADARTPAATGRLRLTFTERSPLSAQAEVLRRLDIDPRDKKYAGAYDAIPEYVLGDESFEVSVPPGYRPDRPHGLFVWVGVGGVPAVWQGVFNRNRLIWISTDPGTGRAGFIHTQLPLDAVHNMKKLDAIDEKRVYVAGFSAGAGIATHLVCAYPDVFRGGYFFMGGAFYVPYKNGRGRWEPTVERMTPTWKGPIDQIKREMRLVLMRGTTDPVFNVIEDRTQYEALSLEGFTRATFIEVPRLGHRLPDATWFEKGIIALDQSKPRIPPTTQPTTLPNPQPGQIAQSQRLLATAMKRLEQKNAPLPFRAKAIEYLKQVVEEYPTTPAAEKARWLLEEK